MADAPSPVYSFGAYVLDPEEGRLTRDGVPIPLTPKAFDLLMVLVRHSGRVVEKDRLLSEVWPDTFVEEGNLTVHISTLRRALGDSSEDTSAMIETIPRRGYRFCLPVEEVWSEPRATILAERRVETRIVHEEFEESAPARFWSPALLAWVVAGTLLVAVAVLGWRVAQNSSASLPPLRVTTFASLPGEAQMPAFAPDGERIAFVWNGPEGKNWDIYVKTVGSDPPMRLTSDAGADKCPTWSPDGRQIAFLRDHHPEKAVGIYVVGALGGAERKLLDLPYNRYFDLEWSPDGRQLAFAEKTDLSLPYDNFRSLAVFLLAVDTLEKRQLTFPEASASDNRFAFSPDGKTLSFVRHMDLGTAIATSLWRVPIEGGAPQKIHEERNWIGHLVWTADGSAIVFTSTREGGNKLFRVSAAGGTPEPLPFAENSAFYPAVSRQGSRLAYVRQSDDSDLWRVELETPRGPGKKPEVLLATPRAETAPEFSPDGKRIAFYSEGTGRREVWISNADGTGAAALTDFHASSTYAPSWSPDGRELAFGSLQGPANSPGGVFAVTLDTREVRRLTGDGFVLPWWSRDGRWIYLTSAPQRGAYEIWKVPAQGGEPVPVVPGDGFFAQESPDGKTLYFSKRAGGIWKKSLAENGPAVAIPELNSVFRPAWRVVEGGVYFLGADAQDRPGLCFFDFRTRRLHLITGLAGNADIVAGGLTISPGRKMIVYGYSTRSASEILLVENFR
jgi:Tol biopolymer transport system component/DNA-binding winged helix-turn-helix (wHTH) protein